MYGSNEKEKLGSERDQHPSIVRIRTLRIRAQRFVVFSCAFIGSVFFGKGHYDESGSFANADEHRSHVSSDDRSAWRSPQHDGVNSLFLFWKLHGVSADYQVLRDSLKEKPSLTDLKKRSIAKGLPCAIVKPVMTSVESIKELQLPAIVLLDNGRGRQSGFHVVYCITEQQQVRMASGSEMTWNEVSLDDFLRHWTGHMLVIDSSYSSPAMTYLAVALSGFIFALYLGFRFRRFSGKRAATLPNGLIAERKPLVTILFLSGFLLIDPADGFCNELPSTVGHQLRHNAKQLDVFQVKWSCQRELLTNQSDLQQSIKQQVDPGFWLESFFEYRFAEGCYHLSAFFHESKLQQDTWQFGKPERRFRESAFDGFCLFTAKARAVGSPPKFLHIRPLERMDPRETISEIEVSFPRAAGFRIPEFQADHGISGCRSLVLLAIDSESANTDCQSIQLGGQTYLHVSVEDFESQSSFYLDPEMGYALVRHEERDRGHRLQRVTFATDFRKVGGTDLWLPQRARIIHHSPPWPITRNSHAEPVYIERITLAEFALERTEETFRLNDSQCGLCIADERLYPNVSADVPIPYYVVSMQEQELDQLVDRFEGEFANPSSAASSLWGGAMVILVIANLLLLVRLGRQRLTQKTSLHF
ncbi:MAG: hypothetical protein P8N76_08100 [Pirellulaceae bacterium]|nr:hypothetical protein [Pirellulaceae bacterium]